MSALRQALEEFVVRVNGNGLVRRMLADWERRILIEARDTGERYFLVSTGSGVGPVEDAGADVEAGSAADMRITGDAGVLTGIFRGERNPAEEYMAGRVGFHGSSRDEMRLDAVIQYVWE